jgi:hypothetical protein
LFLDFGLERSPLFFDLGQQALVIGFDCSGAVADLVL